MVFAKNYLLLDIIVISTLIVKYFVICLFREAMD